MRVGKGLLIGVGLASVLVMTTIVPIVIVNLPKGINHNALMGDDFFSIRRQALALFPRGSRLVEATQGLVQIGFRCVGTPHKMPNVNAQSLECDSNGRGYPTSPALNITVMARNGLVSDFEVWNLLQRADAETHEPPPPPPAAVLSEEKGKPAHKE